MIQTNALPQALSPTDLPELQNFYKKTFGFSTKLFDSNHKLYVTSNDDNVRFNISNSQTTTEHDVVLQKLINDTETLTLQVDDVNLAYLLAQDLDFTILEDLKEEVWGHIHFMIQDASGVIIDVVETPEVLLN